MLVASEEATSGSVIAKQDRMLPRSSGSSHSRCCSAVPYRARTSMFPVTSLGHYSLYIKHVSLSLRGKQYLQEL